MICAAFRTHADRRGESRARLAFSASLDGMIRYDAAELLANRTQLQHARRLWNIKSGVCVFKLSPASSSSLTHMDVAWDMSTIVVADASAAV